MGNPIGYTTRSNVENYLGHTYSEVTNAEFNNYIAAAETVINNHLGYNARTTHSGMQAESIVREKVVGKVDANGNLVINVNKPPIQFDANMNPLVSLVEYNFGAVRVSLQLTDGSSNALNTVLEVSENGRSIVYPSIYFMPYLANVTPTQKVNLFHLRDIKFWVDVSYIGGYYSIPDDIVQACNILVGDIIVRRNNPDFADSVRQGSYSIQYYSSRASDKKVENKAMDNAKILLQPYVRVTW